MNINELNSIGQLEAEKPIAKIKDLALGVQHKVYKCRRVTTRYGPTILLELESSAVFLPKRFAEITDQQVADLKSATCWSVISAKRLGRNTALDSNSKGIVGPY
ncbi:hypothetical protein CBL_20099, partial [Carabus blaptoides fortunei]